MSPEQYDRVLGACRLFVAMGGRLVSRSYGVEFATRGVPRFRANAFPGERPCACAIGALVLCAQPTPPAPVGRTTEARTIALAAALELGTSWFNVRAFVDGFDGCSLARLDKAFARDPIAREWFDAGARMVLEVHPPEPCGEEFPG